MYKSRFSDSQKRNIVRERTESCLSVREICDKYEITIQTFYAWKRRLESSIEIDSKIIAEVQGAAPEAENRILRRLYINLSAHNYELAKFLEK